MPPKRKPTANDEDEDPPKKLKATTDTKTTTSTAITTPVSSSSTTSSVATTDKKTKIKKNSSLLISSDDEELSSEDEEDKSKPWCSYGANCYRKNPDHLKAFRHPAKAKSGKDSKDKDSKSTTKSTAKSTTQDKDKDKDKDKDAKSKDTKDTKDIKDKDKKDSKAKAKAKAKGKGDSDTDKDSDSGQDPADKMKSIKRTASTLDPSVENYKNVLKICLSKNKVSVDEKRMLRTFRRDHDVSDQDHFRLLLQFGWSADEFEDGLKKDDDCDLDEERKVLENNGFAIISIKKGKTLTKEQDNVFSRVCAKFFQTMSKAQANYTIVEVGVIVNSDLRKKFNLKLAEFKQAGYEDVEWGFHGSTRDSIKVISQTGFLHPDNLNKNKGKPAAKKGGKKAASKVTVLDDGFFGKGIYFSFYSDYAMFYSEERNSDQVMLSQVATGKTFKCSGRMDGVDCQKGYNSHYSPKGNEIVVFEPEQILPRYVITFATQDAEEREQEG